MTSGLWVLSSIMFSWEERWSLHNLKVLQYKGQAAHSETHFYLGLLVCCQEDSRDKRWIGNKVQTGRRAQVKDHIVFCFLGNVLYFFICTCTILCKNINFDCFLYFACFFCFYIYITLLHYFRHKCIKLGLLHLIIFIKLKLDICKFFNKHNKHPA